MATAGNANVGFQSADEVKMYLRSTNADLVVKDMLEKMCYARPEDTLAFMISYLIDRHPSPTKVRQIVADSLGDAPSADGVPSASVGGAAGGEVPYQLSKQESWGGSLEEEEEEDADDFQPIAERHIPDRRTRRQAVSAEPLKDENVSDSWEPQVVPKAEEDDRLIREAVSNNILFSHLDEEQRKVCVAAMFLKSFSSGDVIIQQGDEGDNFYVCQDGEVDIFVSRNNNAPELVMSCGRGGSFGELALMYDSPRAATVKAKVPTHLWALDRVTYKRIVMRSTITKRNLYKEFLNQVPIFKSLTLYEKLQIADAMTPLTFNEGEVIVQQGDTGDEFYVIENGEVSVTQGNEYGEGEVGRLYAGDYFGEIALLTDKPRAATVSAIALTRCLMIHRDTFTRVMGPLQDLLKRQMELYTSYMAQANA